jgi:hypothetical protein
VVSSPPPLPSPRCRAQRRNKKRTSW